MLGLEGNMNLDGLFIIIFLILLGPPLLLTFIGLFVREKNKKIAKILFILAAAYLIIGLGVCGSMLVGV